MGRSWIRPLFIIGLAVFVILALFFGRQAPEERQAVTAAPLVRVVTAQPTTYQFSVRANGSVSPSAESELAYLDQSQIPRAGQATGEGALTGAPVVLRAEFAGIQSEWRSSVVRTEAELY